MGQYTRTNRAGNNLVMSVQRCPLQARVFAATTSWRLRTQCCACHSGLIAPGSLQHQVVSLLYSNGVVYHLLLRDLSPWCVSLLVDERGFFFFGFCVHYGGICLWFIYAGNSVEARVLVRGERLYSAHACFRATRSNGFKSVYQRCMYAAAFGYSDEASRDVGLGISAGCVCYSVGGCVCVSGSWGRGVAGGGGANPPV